MTNKPAARPLTKHRSAPLVAIAGAGVIGLVLITLIFMPNGFLDAMTTSPLNVEEADLAEALSLEKNAAYLEDNAKKTGVTVTKSGLQYRQLSAGVGKQPGPTSKVTVHYAGALINGKEFDSSKGSDPITFGLNQVIPGWTEGLQLMREGEKAELVIPQELGYGARGAPGAIPPYQTLVFQVELIKVQ